MGQRDGPKGAGAACPARRSRRAPPPSYNVAIRGQFKSRHEFPSRGLSCSPPDRRRGPPIRGQRERLGAPVGSATLPRHRPQLAAVPTTRASGGRPAFTTGCRTPPEAPSKKALAPRPGGPQEALPEGSASHEAWLDAAREHACQQQWVPTLLVVGSGRTKRLRLCALLTSVVTVCASNRGSNRSGSSATPRGHLRSDALVPPADGAPWRR